MKGVILAGGLGTRLYPLTYATNKHLLPVYDKPMIYYPIQTLVNAGIKDVLVVVSGPHAGDFIPVLKNGKDFGIDHLEYAYQDKPDGGIADALSFAEEFSDGEPLTVILGDNTTDENIAKPVSEFTDGAMIFLAKVANPKLFGVPRFDPTDPTKIGEIIEKPKEPPTEYAVTGLYIYDKTVFDFIRQCQPSARNELEITDVNNFYINSGKLRWAELKFWIDAGSFESLFAANAYWAKKRGVNV